MRARRGERVRVGLLDVLERGGVLGRERASVKRNVEDAVRGHGRNGTDGTSHVPKPKPQSEVDVALVHHQ